MALLELGAAEAEKLVGQYPDVTVAVYAAPEQTVIAGPPEQVDAVIAAVDAQGQLARRVEVDVASHHPTVDPILAELKDALADVKPMTPRIPLISTVGQSGGAAAKFDADYWVVNLRNPVRFSQAVAKAAENHTTFVEVSPHPLLSHAINGTLESAKPRGGAQVSGTLTRDNPETLTFHTQLATITAAVGRRGAQCRRHKETHRSAADAVAARPLLGGAVLGEPATGQRTSAARHPRRVAFRSRARLYGRRRHSISFPTCSTTRCTANRSCPAPASARSRSPPPAKRSACRRSRCPSASRSSRCCR